MQRLLGLVFVGFLFVGCGSSNKPPADGPSPDVRKDGPGGDSQTDVPKQDSPPSDAGMDAIPDTALDAPPADAPPADAPPADAATDEPPMDAATDEPPGEVGVDAAPITLATYVTGEAPGGAHVIFRVTYEPTVAGSGAVTIAATESREGLDGIDFDPGDPDVVVVSSPSGHRIGRFDISSGMMLADAIVNTDLIAVPSGGPGTFPSTVLSASTHFLYVENQFGFAPAPHRIIRKPFAGGAEEVVFNGAASGALGLANYEGLEIVGSRLYFFARDPGNGAKRALMSIGLTGGVWDGMTPVVEIGGLTQGAASGQGPMMSDGSDELDFDPVSGLLFGSNIISGEVVALEPGVGPVSPGGSTPPFFIDPAQVAGGAADGLALLGRQVDGIRSDGKGHLLFAGRGGVMGEIDVAGAMAGVDDGDVIGIFVDPTYTFDDHTSPRDETP